MTIRRAFRRIPSRGLPLAAALDGDIAAPLAKVLETRIKHTAQLVKRRILTKAQYAKIRAHIGVK